jgi:hypothetical protein
MKSLPREKAEFLRILAARIVPESADLDSAGTGRLIGIIDDALQQREPSVRRQFSAFLGVLRWAPLVRHGVPFDRLPGERQDAVLRWFEKSPVGLLRKGTWGLKTMVFMGYYGQPQNHHLLGYVPMFDSRGRVHA